MFVKAFSIAHSIGDLNQDDDSVAPRNIKALDLPEIGEEQDDPTLLNRVECTLSWQSICFTVPTNTILPSFFSHFPIITSSQPKKTILRGISGFAEPGRFLGIIGPSGSGKTTLLNILANRYEVGKLESEESFLVNGQPLEKGSKKYKKIVGYVQQKDHILPFLTVYETLFFAGMFLLPRSSSYSEKKQAVNDIILALDLGRCRNRLIGDSLNPNISGGQLKRVSIAIELLRSPGVLVLDEPTTGLDSLSALRLCTLLHNLARKKGHVVIAVIHQPRAKIFQELDDLLVLSPGGRQIFFGNSEDAFSYVKALDEKGVAEDRIESINYENPADFILDKITPDFENHRASSRRINGFSRRWTDIPEPSFISDSGIANTTTQQRSTIFSQCLWVTLRESVNDLRNVGYLKTRFIQCFFIPLFIGILLFRIGDDEKSVSERTGVIFFTLFTIGVNEFIASIVVFSSNRAVYFHERKSRMYHPISYWIGKQIAILPYQLFFPGMWVLIAYLLSGLRLELVQFGVFFAMSMLVAFYCNSLGLLFAVLLSPNIGKVFGPIYILLSSILSGFLLNFGNMNIFFLGLSYASCLRWGFECLVKNEFIGLELDCNSSTCTFDNGSDVVDSFNFSRLETLEYFAIFFALIFLFRVLLLFALRFSKPK